jgi:ABC-2 type transport system ATP-binding protein
VNSVLSVSNLTKIFGSFTAVDSASFALNQGEILGLLGQNGAGKTTTIQMLLGVLTPTSGSISYFGKPLGENLHKILEEVNFSSAYTNLPYNLLVSDCINYISYFYKIDDRASRVQEIITKFNLEALLKRRVAALSAGEQTRLNLAKAFINRPKIVLLDEPTASLDPENARIIRNFILEQQRNEGLSVIFTSHNMDEVEEVCDRVIFIDSGKITLNDTPDNLARKLDLSTVSFILGESTDRLVELSNKLSIKWEFHGAEVSTKISETKVPELIQTLVNHKIPFHGLTINRASLEEYFFKDSKISGISGAA